MTDPPHGGYPTPKEAGLGKPRLLTHILPVREQIAIEQAANQAWLGRSFAAEHWREKVGYDRLGPDTGPTEYGEELEP